MVEIRALTPDDWRVWRALRLAALAEAPYAFGSRLADWQGAGDREERWRDRLAIDGVHLVAELDGSPVGMASGVLDEEVAEAAELISMWVEPIARGRGVAGALIAAVEEWARAQGFRELRLAVAEGNAGADAAYRRAGFARADRPANPMPDGVRLEYVMAKPLLRTPRPLG